MKYRLASDLPDKGEDYNLENIEFIISNVMKGVAYA